MFEQELHEIAHERIERRNRRWKLWAFDLGGLILTVAGVILLGDTPYVTFSAGVMIAWAAVFVVHTILATMGHSSEGDVAKEVARLRAATYEEKPKRLYLNDDSEISDDRGLELEESERSVR